MKRLLITLCMIACMIAVVSVPAMAQAINVSRAPTLYTATAHPTWVYWTAGTLYNGGTAVTVAAGHVVLYATYNDCSWPGFASCGFIYSNSSGTVATTTVLATAAGSGNTVMALVTAASGVPSAVVPPLPTSGVANVALGYLGTFGTVVPTGAGTVDLGSSALPFRALYLAGNSGTPASQNYIITGTPTTGLRTVTLPDASFTVAGLSVAQTFSAAQTFSSTITPSGGFVVTGRSRYSTVPVGSVAYGSFGTTTLAVTTSTYYAEVYIPRNVTLTGISVLHGTNGSGNVAVGLYTSAGGAAVATSTSTAVSGADVFQDVAFTGTYAAVGPARYWIAVQYDTGTPNSARLISSSTFIDVLTKKDTSTTFGTFPSLTVPTTFSSGAGPIAAVY